MTFNEDVERIRRQHRLARAWLLAREASKWLASRPKPPLSKEEADARQRLADCPAVVKSDEETP